VRLQVSNERAGLAYILARGRLFAFAAGGFYPELPGAAPFARRNHEAIE